MTKVKIIDLLHRGIVFGIVGFCAYATAETYFTIGSALESAKKRMEADKLKELESKEKPNTS